MNATTVPVITIEQLKRESARNDRLIAQIKQRVGQDLEPEEGASLMDILAER